MTLGRIFFCVAFPFFLFVVYQMAFPKFGGPRTKSPVNACINNLRQIEGAKQQWAMEKNKLSNAVPIASDLTPYLGREKAHYMPICPSGGKYTFNPLWQPPTCSITNHILP